MSKNITVLGIETSCDETAAAVVRGGRAVLSNVIASQIPVHKRFGGVVPEIASRQHIRDIITVVDQALREADTDLSALDAVAVTQGPGLAGALLVGVAAAKGLAFAIDKPLIAVNHLHGHIYANLLEYAELAPPFAALIVSGGHTSLIFAASHNDFVLLGETRDDAAGETFDKVARIFSLPYPGGPEVEKLARSGNPSAVKFPRSMKDDQFNFSFSGLKSAVINYAHRARQTGAAFNTADAAASFQAAVVDILSERAVNAVKILRTDKLLLAGGVAANAALRETLAARLAKAGCRLYAPSPALCTDNAAMIACRAYYLYKEGIRGGLSINAEPSLAVTARPCL